MSGCWPVEIPHQARRTITTKEPHFVLILHLSSNIKVFGLYLLFSLFCTGFMFKKISDSTNIQELKKAKMGILKLNDVELHTRHAVTIIEEASSCYKIPIQRH